MTFKTRLFATRLTLLALVFISFDARANEATEKLTREILQNGHAYSDLTELTAIGPRLSGTENAARAVAWAQAKMQSDGFDHVWLQKVQVPHWERGQIARAVAYSTLKERAPLELSITALGGSVGTPKSGVMAEVLEVQSLDEVARLGDKVRGKIIFYNRPMNPDYEDTFRAYTEAVDQRSSGPSVAEKHGAIAVLVRSLTTLTDDDHPHTGIMRRANIPAAALSTHAANVLSHALTIDPKLHVRMALDCENLEPVFSYNVIGEITGREIPDEYVVIGGHLDSWDLAVGAHDDGAGVVQSIEVLRAIRAIGVRPRRSIRAVLFMSEEVGGPGGKAYAKEVQTRGEKHIAAIESDRGGFAPLGFEGDAKALELIKQWAPHLSPLGANHFFEGESGADVGYLDELGIPTFGFVPVSTHYFDYHHSSLDRLEAVNPRELHQGAAAIAVLAWLASEQGL